MSVRPWGSTPNPARFFEKKRGKKLSTAQLRFAQIFFKFPQTFPKTLDFSDSGSCRA